MDRTTFVAGLKEAVHAFVAARGWQAFHTPKNLAMSIAVEAAELMEHFQWLTTEDSIELMMDPIGKEKASEELADILIYCLSFANVTGIDLSDVVHKKLEANKERFPLTPPTDPRHYR